MNKKFFILNTILTFLLGFIVHNLYTWIPSIITTIFPVNESLFEHLKLIYISPIISSLILYYIFKFKINNLYPSLLINIISNILIFYIIYIPIYYIVGESMIFTLSWYFISIILSNIIYYIVSNNDILIKYNRVSIIILITLFIINTYLTYNPIKCDFFKDNETNTYGIIHNNMR